jgi:nucleotide-binding universal stress UspA family protein
LIPHDGSEMSDKALGHAIYLSKISGAEIVILNVIEDIRKYSPTTILATMKGQAAVSEKTKNDLEITVKGEIKQMIDERMRLCKETGLTSQVSYKIEIGKAVDEIVKLSEQMDFDLIVMASSRITSPIITLIGRSTVRKVIDSIKKPVLVIHE